MARPCIGPNLSELSDPLLEKLLFHLDDQSLLEIGATCRKFNTKALTTFFDRRGTGDPENSPLFICEQSSMPLTAIRRAIFIHNLGGLTYYFHPGVEKLFADVYDLTRLVERLLHVGQVRFHFSVFDQWATYKGSGGREVDPAAWKRAMSGLLDKVLDKGCEELSVAGAAEFSNLYPSNPAKGEPRRTFMPPVSPMPVVTQPRNDPPIAVDAMAANLSNTSIQVSKPPLHSEEPVAVKRRGIFSFYRHKQKEKTPPTAQPTARPGLLDGAGDAPELMAVPLINPTTHPESALTSPALSKIQPGNLDGAGDNPILIKPTTWPEPALNPRALSSVPLDRQPEPSLNVKGNEDCIAQTRKMTLLHIHSKMLLDEPFLDWTISAIMASASTLTTLSFKCSSIHMDVWRLVLLSLSLPHLQDFSLMADFLVTVVPGAYHQDLHYFLARHPTIKVLNLYGLSKAGSHFIPLAVPILPNLVNLKAHPHYINWILSSIELDPTSMPGLTSVTIGSEYLCAGLFKYTEFDSAIRSVAKIRRKVKLCICFAGQPECDIYSWLQSHLSMSPPSPITSLHHIQDLVISSFFFADLPAPVLYLLPVWLNLFPALRSLKFEELPPEVTQRIDALNFKQILADGCPTMERMFDWKGMEVSLRELRGRGHGMEDGRGD